jgi:hypothetical protein
MPPKKSPSGLSKAAASSEHHSYLSSPGTDFADDLSYCHRFPTARRLLVATLFLVTVGVPCPSHFFYSTFLAHSSWLRVFFRTGVFSDAVFICEQTVGPLYTHDHQYYSRLQRQLNLTDEDMFGYLQQWVCLMPPDGYGNEFPLPYLLPREPSSIDLSYLMFLCSCIMWCLSFMYHVSCIMCMLCVVCVW